MFCLLKGSIKIFDSRKACPPRVALLARPLGYFIAARVLVFTSWKAQTIGWKLRFSPSFTVDCLAAYYRPKSFFELFFFFLLFFKKKAPFRDLRAAGVSLDFRLRKRKSAYFWNLIKTLIRAAASSETRSENLKRVSKIPPTRAISSWITKRNYRFIQFFKKRKKRFKARFRIVLDDLWLSQEGARES